MKYVESDTFSNDIIDAANIFPKAYRLYRLGIPPPE